MEVLNLCNVGTVNVNEKFTSTPFTTQGDLTSQHYRFPIQFLVDTGASGYSFVDRSMVKPICECLHIEPIPMARRKLVRGYDGKISATPLTHCIHPNLTLQGHKELSIPMYITDLGSHPAILGLPWLRRFTVWLDCGTDSLWFPTVEEPIPVQLLEAIAKAKVKIQSASSLAPRLASSLSSSLTPNLDLIQEAAPKLPLKILPRPKPVLETDDTASM